MKYGKIVTIFSNFKFHKSQQKQNEIYKLDKTPDIIISKLFGQYTIYASPYFKFVSHLQGKKYDDNTQIGTYVFTYIHSQ